MKTFTPGNDATLDGSITLFQAKLRQLGFNIEEASCFNPVPNVWSVCVRDVDAPMNIVNGSGTTKEAALVSALGEYFKCLSMNDFYTNYYLGEEIANSEFVHYPNEKWFPLDLEDNLPPEGILDEHLNQFYDPTLELLGTDLIDLQSSNMERGVCTLPFERQRGKEAVYIPVNIIGNLYASNGISVGNSKAEARMQGLSGIIEQAIRKRILAERTSLPEIPASVLERFPMLKESLNALEAEGFPVNCYDASLGGKYPVICITVLNPESNTHFVAFGAHPQFEQALERAIAALLPKSTFGNDGVSEQPNLKMHFTDASGLMTWEQSQADANYDFVDWNFNGNAEERFNHLMSIFTAERADVYIADYSHLGVTSCRIIVPGWSETYPVEMLIEANNNVAMELRETFLALPNVEWEAEQYAEMYSILEEEGFDDSCLLHEIIGLAPQVGSAWQTLRIGELKCLLALAGGDLELALEFASQCTDCNTANYSTERAHFFHCLVASLNLALDEERDPLLLKAEFESQYDTDIVAAVWGSIEGTVRFHGLTAGNLSMKQFPAHQKLLASYQKLQAAKKAQTV
ncbi:30S ribosomal protein S12 methylthiotransferase accessory factor YcaO [Photobacterium minamisatsumaniensis]|uniref:30S ribosomal protein S12 methylthiotransferase accessory factor YcaO n=1 Tax=Photobacterium minamisatsumaniensis TaxID=2910233 RepID=UPI003D138174